MKWFLMAVFPALMACSATPMPETYSGYYRQAFEQSDFYTLDGGGPYWLDGNEIVFATLQDYLVPKDGRGSHITVKLTVQGTRQDGGQFGHIGRYPTQLYATQIVSVETISPEEFDRRIRGFRSKKRASN